MNREIKFRAWDEKRKIFHYWGYLKPFGNDIVFVSPPAPHYPSQEFTGLKDANGTDIYEGDIISPIEVDEKYKSVNYPIEWDNNKARFSCRYGQEEWKVLNIDQSFMEQCNLKIIGNIHQNPELL